MLTIPAIIVLLPIIIILPLLVSFLFGSSPFFYQQRPGLFGKPFTLYKFRTMTEQTGEEGHLLPDAKRLTTFGRFLRSTSMDELPELFNVLRGEMSLVGPRPLLMRYNPYFTDEERVRFSVRPGITGLAQISGRNDASWNLRLAADVQYVQNLSFGADLKILFLTVLRVLMRHGVRSDPGATMLDLDEERRYK
jgi:lipopolysaccharide/colanic/teichoic acid biosynthesis glycosyltransferase